MPYLFIALVCELLVAASAAAAPSLTVVAGLGGLVRPSRWVPVQVTITSPEAETDTTGDLLVSWGDATVRRQVRLQPAATRRIVLYLRSAAPEPTLRARLEVGRTVVAETDVPLQSVRDDEPLTLCITAADMSTASCSIAMRPDELPASPRGYDAADEVLWPGGAIALPSAQAAAHAQWRALRSLATSGALSLTPQPRRPTLRRGLPWASARALLPVTALYVGVLTGLAGWSLRRPRSAATVGAMLTTGVMAGGALTWGLGQIGPFQAVRLYHDSVVQQIPGTDAALLTMRGGLELPARTSLALRFPHPDGTMELVTPRGRAETVVDADGFPTIRGTFGIDERPSFELEAVVPTVLLAVKEDEAGVRVTNVSQHAMEGCEPGDGFSGQRTKTIASGATIQLERDESSTDATAGDDISSGPLITCTVAELPFAVTEARRPVEYVGRTLVAIYRLSGNPLGASWQP